MKRRNQIKPKKPLRMSLTGDFPSSYACIQLSWEDLLKAVGNKCGRNVTGAIVDNDKILFVHDGQALTVAEVIAAKNKLVTL